MEISPLLLLKLILASLCFGGAMGGLHDVNRLIRVFLGAHYSPKTFARLYAIRLPIVGRSLGELKEGKIKRVVRGIVIGVQDILWFAVAGGGTVILNYYFNNGKFRIYTVIAILIGFLVYYFTLGRLVMLLSEAIVFLIRSAFLILFTLICRPIVKIVEFFGKSAKKFVKKVTKTIAKKRKQVYNKHIKNSLLQKAKSGFLQREDQGNV